MPSRALILLLLIALSGTFLAVNAECGTTGGGQVDCTNDHTHACTDCGPAPCCGSDSSCWSCAGSDGQCYPYYCESSFLTATKATAGGGYCSTNPCTPTPPTPPPSGSGNCPYDSSKCQVASEADCCYISGTETCVDNNNVVCTNCACPGVSPSPPTPGPPTPSTTIPDGKYTSTCTPEGDATFCSLSFEFTEESGQHMMKIVTELGTSQMACEDTYTYILKYDGSAVETTAHGECIAKVTKGSNTTCTCTDKEQAYQFSVDANTGVVTLSAGGQSQQLTPTKADSSGGGTSIVLIAGIAGGAVVVLLLLAGGVYFYKQQQQKKQQLQPGDYVDANQAFITNEADAKSRGGSHV